MLGERKSSMCRSRVARGHFTLMAARPIEMTAALHDLKVRRQRIIFHRWRRGIGGVKWCLPNKPPLLRWIIAEQPRWNQHSAKARRYYTGARRTMKTDQIARVSSAPIHHNEKFCHWKFKKLCLWKQWKPSEPPHPPLHTGAERCFNRPSLCCRCASKWQHKCVCMFNYDQQTVILAQKVLFAKVNA